MPTGLPFFILASYLFGAFPTAYLVARWARGIDIRSVGSGNVGGSNLRSTVGTWATVCVGLFDIGKGAVPVWLVQRIGWGDNAAIVAGLAAIAGHNWSPWLGFQGGRGIGSTLGVLLVRFPFGVAWVLGLMALGTLLNEVALLNGLGVLTLPLLAAYLGEPSVVLLMCVGLVSLMLLKRIEANQGRSALTQRSVWLGRILHDRDEH